MSLPITNVKVLNAKDLPEKNPPSLFVNKRLWSGEDSRKSMLAYWACTPCILAAWLHAAQFSSLWIEWNLLSVTHPQVWHIGPAGLRLKRFFSRNYPHRIIQIYLQHLLRVEGRFSERKGIENAWSSLWMKGQARDESGPMDRVWESARIGKSGLRASDVGGGTCICTSVGRSRPKWGTSSLEKQLFHDLKRSISWMKEVW